VAAEDHWERLAAKEYMDYIKTLVTYKTTIPTGTSVWSPVDSKQGKKEKDKNTTTYLRDAARDQVSKVN